MGTSGHQASATECPLLSARRPKPPPWRLGGSQERNRFSGPLAHCEGDSLYKHHPRTDMDAVVQVHDVFVVHADAARGHETADRAWIVGAVDGEFAVDQHQRRGAHRVSRRATLDIEVR